MWLMIDACLRPDSRTQGGVMIYGFTPYLASWVVDCVVAVLCLKFSHPWTFAADSFWLAEDWMWL